MPRYIDADALCEALMTRWNTADQNAEKLISEIMADIVTPIVVSMPTADVVSKEKYDELNERYHRLLESANILAGAVCDYERREDGTA